MDPAGRVLTPDVWSFKPLGRPFDSSRRGSESTGRPLGIVLSPTEVKKKKKRKKKKT